MEPTTETETRMYVVVRGDLPVGYQMAQSAHAVAELMAFHDALDLLACPKAIVLNARDEPHLEELFCRAEGRARTRSGPACFHEPDLDDEMTAFAVFCDSDVFDDLPVAGGRPGRLARFVEALRGR